MNSRLWRSLRGNTNGHITCKRCVCVCVCVRLVLLNTLQCTIPSHISIAGNLVSWPQNARSWQAHSVPCNLKKKQTDISPESMLLSVPIVDLRTTCAIPSPPYTISGTQPIWQVFFSLLPSCHLAFSGLRRRVCLSPHVYHPDISWLTELFDAQAVLRIQAFSFPAETQRCAVCELFCRSASPCGQRCVAMISASCQLHRLDDFFVSSQSYQLHPVCKPPNDAHARCPRPTRTTPSSLPPLLLPSIQPAMDLHEGLQRNLQPLSNTVSGRPMCWSVRCASEPCQVFSSS